MKQAQKILETNPGHWLIILMISVFASCNSADKNAKTNNTDSTAINPDSVHALDAAAGPNLRFRYYVLDSQTIADNATELFPKSSGTMNTRIICKLRFNGVASNTFMADMLMYPSEDHGKHGKDKDFFTARDSASKYKTFTSPVILGNNYFHWDAFKDMIFEKVGSDYKIKAGFGYFLLEPMITIETSNPSHPICSKCNGHLWYAITLWDKKGNPWGGAGGGGEGSTNPSPPAEP